MRPAGASGALPTLVSFGGRLPVLCADHGQTYLALLVNVGVINLCLEGDLGGLKRVLGGEDDFDSERTFVIRRVVLEESRGCLERKPWWMDAVLPGGTYRDDESLP